MRTRDTSLLGIWKIEQMATWPRGAFELLGPAFFEFESREWGRFRFIAVTGDIDCRVSTREGKLFVEFSWQGHDESDPACGRGWATVAGDELRGHIYIHAGEDSAFTARRSSHVPVPPSAGGDRTQHGETADGDGNHKHHPVSLDLLVSEVEGLMFDWHACVNTKTGEVASYGEDTSLISGLEDDEDYDGPEWLQVPYPDEDGDWRMMHAFASTQADGAREALWRTLDSRRPFGAFRAEVRARGLQDAWYAHQHDETRRLLKLWLAAYEVPINEEGAPQAG